MTVAMAVVVVVAEELETGALSVTVNLAWALAVLGESDGKRDLASEALVVVGEGELRATVIIRMVEAIPTTKATIKRIIVALPDFIMLE